MICFNCKRQIPDNVQNCPACGSPIIPQVQIRKEVKFRRFQRWVLYLVIAVVFSGMTAYAIKISTDNTQILNKFAETQNALNQTKSDLDAASKNLTAKEGELAQAQSQVSQLTEEQTALNQKTADYQKMIEEQSNLVKQYNDFKVDLGAANANVYAALVKLALGISNKDLAKIPVADYNLGSGVDTDKDGLSDVVEGALGTDPAKDDTNANTYKDKQEILNGYNPIGSGKLVFDSALVSRLKGDILLQVEHKSEAWYLSPKDGKRYFLGLPGDAVKALEKLNSATSTVQ